MQIFGKTLTDKTGTLSGSVGTAEAEDSERGGGIILYDAKKKKTHLTGNSNPIALGRSDLGHRSVGHIRRIGDSSRSRLRGHLPSTPKGNVLI